MRSHLFFSSCFERASEEEGKKEKELAKKLKNEHTKKKLDLFIFHSPSTPYQPTPYQTSLPYHSHGLNPHSPLPIRCTLTPIFLQR